MAALARVQVVVAGIVPSAGSGRNEFCRDGTGSAAADSGAAETGVGSVAAEDRQVETWRAPVAAGKGPVSTGKSSAGRRSGRFSSRTTGIPAAYGSSSPTITLTSGRARGEMVSPARRMTRER